MWWMICNLLASPGLAQEPEASSDSSDELPPDVVSRGRELFENGLQLYNEGRYEPAITAWKEGYGLTKKPGFLFNIANAHERLGQYPEALDVLLEYRALARAEERETLERRMRALEARAAEAEALRAAQAARQARDMTPLPEAPPIEGKRRTGLGLGIVGAGMATVGVGGVFGLLSMASGQSALGNCSPGINGAVCLNVAEPDLDRAQRFAIAADISYATGALLVVAGTVVATTRGKPRRGAASVSLSPRSVAVTYRW